MFFHHPPIKRAGIILHDWNWLVFGIDAVHQEMTDFGGGVKANEHPWQAALRELKEETLGLVQLTLDDLRASIPVQHGHVLVLFVDVSHLGGLAWLCQRYQQIVSQQKEEAKPYEVDRMVAINLHNFHHCLVRYPKIYDLILPLVLQGVFYLTQRQRYISTMHIQ